MGGKKEIGSEFWTQVLPEDENGLQKLFPANIVHMMCGRAAICYAIEEFSARDDIRTAYLPAYTCHTTIAPFIKKGYTVRFYDLDNSFNPIFDHRLLESISVLYIEGYFGFPNHEDSFLSECRSRGKTIIHDITHTMFSQNGMSVSADYLIGSLRKWFGIPSGGIAVSMDGSFQKKPAECDGAFIQMRKNALDTKREYIQTGSQALKADALRLFSEAEEYLSRIFDTQASDEDSIRAAHRFPVDEMIKKRRENYRCLQDSLTGIPGIEPAFPGFGPGICPLFFPIFSDRRDALKQRLVSQRIYTPVHWPVPDAIDIDKYPNAKGIYGRILSIPCDQRYDSNDMLRIGEIIKCST